MVKEITCDVICGMGEIGKSLFSFIRSSNITTYGIDMESSDSIFEPVDTLEEFKERQNNWNFKVRILNICFPYSKDFVKEVKRYQKELKPEYTVIHSTVPIGTSKKCNAIHSPVTGIHPHLEDSLRTFTKFFGGKNASYVADIFMRLGMKVYVVDKAETTELMKIACTTNYGLNIEYTKHIKELCDKYKVPFELFTIWNNNYNDGYEKLGYPQYHRYNLVPLMKDLGGHCVVPNLELLDSKFTKFMRSLK